MANIEKVGRYEIDRFMTGEEVSRDTDLSDTSLNDGFLNQAGLAAYYGSAYAKASRQLADLKLKRDLTFAKVSSTFRENAASSNTKITEAGLAEKVQQDPRVLEVISAYNLAIEVEAETKAIVDSVRQRRDMLVQLGSFERDEAKGELRMKMTSGVSNRANDIKSKLAKPRK
jgi:hypothetical protein